MQGRLLKVGGIDEPQLRNYGMFLMRRMFQERLESIDISQENNLWEQFTQQQNSNACHSSPTTTAVGAKKILIMMVGIPGSTHKLVSRTLAILINCHLERQSEAPQQTFFAQLCDRLDTNHVTGTTVVIADRANHTCAHRFSLMEAVKMRVSLDCVWHSILYKCR
jgi:hypothetical protein